MSKTVNIFLDTKVVTWGDGTHLNHNDSTFRGNIKADTAINGSGYLVNGVPNQLTYSNATFTTPKPVKLVLSTGSTTAIDLATAYSGTSLLSNTEYPSFPVLNGTTIRANNYNEGTAIMFGVLNDTAKKSDGTDATNNAEAVYFEIVWQVGKIDYSYDFVGMEATLLDYPQSGSGEHGTASVGVLFFDSANYQPKTFNGGKGEYIATVATSLSIRPFNYSKSYQNQFDQIGFSSFQIVDGVVLRYELGINSRAKVNITNSLIHETPHSFDFSNTLIAPFLYVGGGDYIDRSVPTEIDNAKIVITNPA